MNSRMPAALAAVTLLLLSGCSSDSEPPSTETRTRPAAARASTVVLPDLTGMNAAAARDQARELGLAVRAMPGATSVCVPRRSVVRQQPVAGSKVDPGSRVRLRVNVGGTGECERGLPPAAVDLRGVAERFVAFARDLSGEHGLPADTPVELFLDGAPATVIPSAALGDRGAWQGALSPFVNYPGPIAATSEPPAHPCLRREAALPDRLDAYRTVTLTPEESRDCTSYFAMQLFVNDVGQVVAADLVRSEP